MADNIIKAGVQITAGVDGLENINRLAKEIESAGGDASHLQDKYAKLNQEFERIGKQQALIDGFRRLKTESQDVAAQLEAARKKTAELAQAVQKNPTDKLVQDFEQAKNQAATLKIRQEELNRALHQSRQAMQQAGISVRDLAKHQNELKAQSLATRERLSDLNEEAAKLLKTAQARAVLGINVDDGITQKLTQINQAYLNLKQNGSLSQQELAQATAAYRAELEKLAADSDEAKSHLAQLDKEARKLQQTAQARTVLGLDVDDQAREEIKKLDRAFAELKRNGSLSQAELARAAELHKQKVGELEASLGRVKPKLTDIAEAVGGIVGKAGGLAYITREAADFEAAIGKVKKVTDGTPEQMAKLSAEIKNMAGQLGIMPAELADIAAAGGQMGLEMAKLPEFTRMAAQMSRAFGISADQAGDMAAKISNVFGLQLAQMGELGDAINTLGNTTAAKEAEIADVLTRIGGNAKQFGLAAEEAAALGAAFISLGKTPEVAGTAINALLTKLQTAPVQTDKFQNSLQKLGLSAEQMAANIQANPQAALTDFLQRLEQVDKQSRAIMLAEMFGAEYSDDLALLTGSLKTYSAALDTATDKARTHGAMQKEAATALETLKGKADIAQSSIAATAASLGETLLPVLKFTADAVGGAARGIQFLTEQFPLLTNLAVGIAAAKLAVSGFQTVIKMTGKDSVRAMEDTDKSVKKVRGSLKGAAADAKLFGMAMKNADGSSTKLGKVKDALGGVGNKLTGLAEKAGQLGAVFTAAFSIGDAAYQEFEIVRTIGDELGRLVAYAEAILPWTDRTLEDVKTLYKTSKELADEAAEAQKQATEAAKQRSEAEKKAAEAQAVKIQALQAEYRRLNHEYNANAATMETLKQAGKENSAMYRDLAMRQTELGIKVQATGAHLAKLNAQIGDTGPLAESKKALEALGLTAEQVATGISDKAQTALKDFGQAAAQFGNDAEQMQRIFQAALSKMGDSPEAIAALKTELEKVGKQAGLSAEQIRKIGDTADTVSSAFEKIGVDSQAVLNGISREARKAFDDFTAASKAAKDAGINDSRLIAAGFEQMMDKLKSPAEFAAFRAQLQQSGDAAKLTQEQLNRLNAAAKDGAAVAQTAYEKLAESVKKAGDTRAAEAAGQAAAAAMKRGEISAEQYQQVLEAVKQRTEELKQKSAEAGQKAAESHQQAAAAAEKQAQAAAQAADAAKNGAAAQKESGKAVADSVKPMNDYQRALDEIARKTKAYRHIGTAAWIRVGEYIRATYDTAQSAIKGLNTATENGIGMADRLAHAEAVALSNADKLDKASLDNLHAAIDKARQKMQALADDAKQTREDLQASLDELNGDSDAGARLAQQRKIAELRKKQQQAERTGNRDAAADYAQSVELQQQIWQRQQAKKAEEAARQQREAEERAEQERQREAERQRQEAERRQQEIRLPERTQVAVNIDNDRLLQALAARDGQVAGIAVEQVISGLEQALQRSR